MNEALFASEVVARTDHGDTDRLDTNEIWLALACSEGNKRALARFEQDYCASARSALARMGLCEADIKDVLQMVRHRLLIAKPRAKLLDYAGRGELRRLVRVAAVRVALNAARDQKARANVLVEATRGTPASPMRSPQDKLQKYQDSVAIKRAVASAAAQLSARERALLRMRLLEGLSSDDIGTFYGVHRATAARWVLKAQARLRDYVRQELVAAWQAPHDELSAMSASLDSQVRLSLPRILGAASCA